MESIKNNRSEKYLTMSKTNHRNLFIILGPTEIRNFDAPTAIEKNSGFPSEVSQSSEQASQQCRIDCEAIHRSFNELSKNLRQLNQNSQSKSKLKSGYKKTLNKIKKAKETWLEAQDTREWLKEAVKREKILQNSTFKGGKSK
jgi:hypothetical protein